MVKLTFLGGVDEIGGNKILVEDKESSVFFDFGKSFTSGCEYFASWLAPREINGLRDYFEFNTAKPAKRCHILGSLELYKAFFVLVGT